MPCCGLEEYRERVHLRFTIVGALVFSSAFALTTLGGTLLVWHPLGRRILITQFSFVRALWADAMRTPTSTPARWACRLSGRLFRPAPTLAAFVYRHPELPLIAIGACVLGAVAGLVRFLFS